MIYEMFIFPKIEIKIVSNNKKIIFKLGYPTKIDLALTYFHPLWKIKVNVVLKENCLLGLWYFFILKILYIFLILEIWYFYILF